MSMNSVSSTNLLNKYTSAPKLPTGNNAVEEQSKTSKSQLTKEQDLILKQDRLIKLQKQEIDNLKSSQKSSSNSPVTTILSVIGVMAVLNMIFNYRSPQRIQAEMQQAARQMQDAMADSLRRAMQVMDDVDADVIAKPVEQSKHIINAIFNSDGKVVGKKIFDRATNKLLKIIEYYPGTKKPSTIESFDYVNQKINYNWYREDGTKAMQELFDLDSRKKIKTIFYKEDGKTIDKIKNA